MLDGVMLAAVVVEEEEGESPHNTNVAWKDVHKLTEPVSRSQNDMERLLRRNDDDDDDDEGGEEEEDDNDDEVVDDDDIDDILSESTDSIEYVLSILD
jgi:hypothetical protein